MAEQVKALSPQNLQETGKLTRARATGPLELNGIALFPGNRLDLYVFGHWIPGHIAQDNGGWFLLTLDHVGIRLRPGLLARSPRHVQTYPSPPSSPEAASETKATKVTPDSKK